MANTKLPPLLVSVFSKSGAPLPAGVQSAVNALNLSDEELKKEAEFFAGITGGSPDDIFKTFRSTEQQEKDVRAVAKKSVRNQALQRRGRSSTILSRNKSPIPKSGGAQQPAQRPSGGIFSRSIASLLKGGGSGIPGGQLGGSQNALQAFRGANALLG